MTPRAFYLLTALLALLPAAAVAIGAMSPTTVAVIVRAALYLSGGVLLVMIAVDIALRSWAWPARRRPTPKLPFRPLRAAPPLRKSLRQRAVARLGLVLLERVMVRRPADVVIGGAAAPYLKRWFLIPRNRWFNIYLHLFLRSDDDRALHDHPWLNCSLLLQGQYTEHTIAAGGVHHRALRLAGDVVVRRAKSAHRIELHAGSCITLFFTGPVRRGWGFHCPQRWVPWRDFTSADGREVGRGCDQ
ncbi:hypothetical protein [Tahibacter harae]|uniref:SRCR domain-containing protein n=1 Tax=Tahibacter harae TaxID=2963937 RepID=A0ABT1QS30_9GAMM|nr:hypothetical protein [Tahibacter harae]MCQ4165110.1 hypothetical protein [Tahibacter harae]